LRTLQHLRNLLLNFQLLLKHREQEGQVEGRLLGGEEQLEVDCEALEVLDLPELQKVVE
jgi:hypothetical protein